MASLREAILSGEDFSKNETIGKHYEWAMSFKKKYDKIDESNVDDIIKNEIGIVYSSILEQCGVFARNEKGRAHIDRFAEYVNKLITQCE